MRLPSPVANYLLASQIERRSPAYLLLNTRGELLKWGGKTNLYGFDRLAKRQLLREQLSFLIGTLPLPGPSTCLNFVKLRSEVFADVHLISTKEGTWVVFLDASAEAAQLSSAQQKRNELAAQLEAPPPRGSLALVSVAGRKEQLDLRQALAALENAGNLLRRILGDHENN